MMEQIFKLKRVHDIPIYGEGLASHGNHTLLNRDSRDCVREDSLFSDFFPTISSGWDWEPTPLLTKWRVPELLGNPSPHNDFPCMDLSIPAFSLRAAECLHDLLEPNGELLPARCNGTTYYVYNCLKVVEIVNQSESRGFFLDSTRKGKFRRANAISYLEIYPSRLTGLSIFKLREMANGAVFVTQLFRERVFENGLNGFDFVKVWPMQKGTDSLLEHMKLLKLSRAKKSITIDSPEELERQSLVIEIPMPDPACFPEAKATIDHFKRDIRQLLENIGPNDQYGGCLKKTRGLKESTVLSFSCPSSEILLKRLEPGLKSLMWKEPIRVTLRDVPLEDITANRIDRIIEV